MNLYIFNINIINGQILYGANTIWEMGVLIAQRSLGTGKKEYICP